MNIILAKNGTPFYRIVVDKNADDIVMHAATELQKYLYQASKANFIYDSTVNEQIGPEIRVGQNVREIDYELLQRASKKVVEKSISTIIINPNISNYFKFTDEGSLIAYERNMEKEKLYSLNYGDYVKVKKELLKSIADSEGQNR